MPVPRTELRDELTALIAAGRELTPDHDEALADVFLERLAREIVLPSPTRRPRRTRRKPGRLIGSAIVALASLGTILVVNVHHAGSAAVVQPAITSKSQFGPFVGKGLPMPKPPVVPLPPKIPAPKSSP